MGSKHAMDIERVCTTDSYGSSYDGIYLRWTLEPKGVYVRRDLKKIVFVGNGGSLQHKPFFSIYDIETDTQIEKGVYVQYGAPSIGEYCFGNFDKKDDRIFMFGIGICARKIFYVNTDTGDYEEKVVNPTGEAFNEELCEILPMIKCVRDRKSYGYVCRILVAAKDNAEDHMQHVVVFCNDFAIAKFGFKHKVHQAYFVTKQMSDSERLMLIIGFVRKEWNDAGIFPQELFNHIRDYAKLPRLFLIAQASTELRINQIV